MKRRTTLTALLAAGMAPAVIRTSEAAAPEQRIELYVDMSVDPAKEKDLLQNFKTIFRPAARKQAGFVDVKILKLRTAIQGAAPAAGTHRFVISFKSEEHRQKWVATDIHQKVWPTLENTLTSKNYTVLLYDAT